LVDTPEDYKRGNIVTVDHIPHAAEFAKSARILKEVKLFAPNI